MVIYIFRMIWKKNCHLFKQEKQKMDTDIIYDLDSLYPVAKSRTEVSDFNISDASGNVMSFEDASYNMRCGQWIVNDTGIYYPTNNDNIRILYHPIVPVAVYINEENGQEYIKLAYQRRHVWKEIVVPKTMISTTSKIITLSDFGLLINSTNASKVIKYLEDVEGLNEDKIPIIKSSGKLGWHGDVFLPYDDDMMFDANAKFPNLSSSLQTKGDYKIWMDTIWQLRKSDRLEIKALLAASFASPLLSVVSSLPFFVDLNGSTEGGKSVTLKVITSIWADPDESKYIGDFKSTDAALEAKADVLNHLPLILDDTSRTSDAIRNNFESLVYDLCAGKGKSRSNLTLGLNPEQTWQCVIIVTGERPLNSYVDQGGALNRILEVEMHEKLYSDPANIVHVVHNNYGFAGREYIGILKRLGRDWIKRLYQHVVSCLQSESKMQKQIMSLAAIITADIITERFIFKDEIRISTREAETLLLTRQEVSDNERAYNFLIEKIAMNSKRFGQQQISEGWGLIENNIAIIISQAFDQLCREGNFSRKSFLSWAAKKNLIQVDKAGRKTKVKNIEGTSVRCIYLILPEQIDNSID